MNVREMIRCTRAGLCEMQDNCQYAPTEHEEQMEDQGQIVIDWHEFTDCFKGDEDE
jgi:hypothetical protein